MEQDDYNWRDTEAVRWYSLASVLSTLALSAFIAWLLDLELQAVVLTAGSIGVVGAGTAVAARGAVFSRRTHELALDDARQIGENRANQSLNAAAEEWEDALGEAEGNDARRI